MKTLFSISFLLLSVFSGYCQKFIPLWDSKMPNSKGLDIKDSIANERIYQVGTPGIYVFETSVAENKNAAVLITPPGGYARLVYQAAGFQLAKWFNTMGITAFVLIHRLPKSPDVIESYKAPLQDGQRAMKYIRANAKNWNIDANKIGVMGCSAGGHLSACLSTINDDWSIIGDKLDAISFRPNFTILVSPVITMNEYIHKGSRDNLLGKDVHQSLLDKFSCNLQVTEKTPPAFMAHATNDKTVSPMNSILYYTALKKNNVEMSTIHVFPEGGHDIALRNNPGTTNTWTSLAEGWLREIGIIGN